MNLPSDHHAKKFAGFDRALSAAKAKEADYLVVHSPCVLGDEYEELVVNLDKLAEAKLALLIVPPSERSKTVT